MRAFYDYIYNNGGADDGCDGIERKDALLAR